MFLFPRRKPNPIKNANKKKNSDGVVTYNPTSNCTEVDARFLMSEVSTQNGRPHPQTTMPRLSTLYLLAYNSLQAIGWYGFSLFHKFLLHCSDSFTVLLILWQGLYSRCDFGQSGVNSLRQRSLCFCWQAYQSVSSFILPFNFL